MPFLILLIVLVAAAWLMFSVIGFTIGLVLTLLVAGVVGWLADLVVPGELPGGWIGAVIAGVLGGLIGGMLFRLLGIHDPGFGLFGISLIPALVGAVIVAVGAELVTRNRRLA